MTCSDAQDGKWGFGNYAKLSSKKLRTRYRYIKRQIN
jgi:hypothetical protein